VLWHIIPKAVITFQEDNSMKKVLVVILMLAMVGGAFAQEEEKKANISISGAATLDFGLGVNFGAKEDDSTPNSKERDSEASWIFRPDDMNIGVTGEAGPVSAGITLKAASGTAELYNWFAAVDLNIVELKVGKDLLPWIQWSSIDFMGDNNWAAGASGVKDTYLQVKYGKDSISIYGGLMAAGVDAEILKDNAVFPGFYLGGDFAQEKFSVGAAFAGVPRGKKWGEKHWNVDDDGPWNGKDEARFGWMGDLHAKVNFEPITVGLNVAMYGDPSVCDSWWTPTGFDEDYGYYITSGVKEDFIFEGMLDIGIGLAPCNIGIAAGLVANLANKDDGGGAALCQLGANATFKLGGGFRFNPGVIFVLPIKDVGNEDPVEKGFMQIGITLGYSF
jgi:hypothetical protein